MWWKRWAVYLPLDDVEGPRMRDSGGPAFIDDDGQWWGERIGGRYWTRRRARRVAFEYQKRWFRTQEMYAELRRRAGGPVGVTANRLREWRVGLAGESGWYSRSSSGRAAGVRVPRWAWAAYASAAVVLPVGLYLADLVAPAASGWWRLLATVAGGVVGVVVTGRVLRRSSGGGR